MRWDWGEFGYSMFAASPSTVKDSKTTGRVPKAPSPLFCRGRRKANMMLQRGGVPPSKVWFRRW